MADRRCSGVCEFASRICLLQCVCVCSPLRLITDVSDCDKLGGGGRRGTGRRWRSRARDGVVSPKWISIRLGRRPESIADENHPARAGSMVHAK